MVLRRYVFDLRKQLKDLSSVAIETGIVRSTEKMVGIFRNEPVAYKPLKKSKFVSRVQIKESNVREA